MESSAQPDPAHQRDPAAPTDAGDHGDAADASSAKPSRGRRILVNSLIAFTTLLLVVGIFSIWANRLLFNPDNWSNTSTQLLQNADIRSTTANYLVDQLYANVDVTGLISSGLPPRLVPLAAPAAGALRNVAVKGATSHSRGRGSRICGRSPTAPRIRRSSRPSTAARGRSRSTGGRSRSISGRSSGTSHRGSGYRPTSVRSSPRRSPI